MIKITKKDILNHVKVTPNKGFINWYNKQVSDEITNLNRLLGEILNTKESHIDNVSDMVLFGRVNYRSLQDIENASYNASLVAKIMSDKVKQLKVNNTPAGVR